MLRRFGTVFVTAVLVSALWIFYHGITGSYEDRNIQGAGDRSVVHPASAPAVTSAGSVTVGPAGLAIPVAGVTPDQLVDTYTQARAGGAHAHDAIDIMAAEGTPVIAAAPGTVEKLFVSHSGGGITAYIRSSDGRWSYYYAHLQRYADGLREGQKLGRGEPVGFVGHTGNASPDGPHLHFAINRMKPGETWYEGTPVNPYPLLAGTPVTR